MEVNWIYTNMSVEIQMILKKKFSKGVIIIVYNQFKKYISCIGRMNMKSRLTRNKSVIMLQLTSP